EKEVTYQGEIVAAVLAETKSQAADAANLIQVEYQDLPAVMDLEKALQKGSPKSHVDGPDNVCWDFTYTGPEITEAAFKEADVVVKERILQNRLAPVPMEPRGVSADYEGFDKKLTIWMSSQNPHFIRLFVSGAMGLKESQVRVVSPDVGGGFGSKISPYPEDYLVPTLSRIAERPVKWTETRTESIQKATHLVERMVDLVALELKMDPVAIRRKNFIQPEDFPFTQNFGLVVDSGDYDKALDKALQLIGYDELRKKQAELRKQGRYMGIGF